MKSLDGEEEEEKTAGGELPDEKSAEINFIPTN